MRVLLFLILMVYDLRLVLYGLYACLESTFFEAVIVSGIAATVYDKPVIVLFCLHLVRQHSGVLAQDFT